MAPGVICLQGGAEFGPGCREMDRALVELADGPVVVTALAGAPGRETRTADDNGVAYFRSLGAEASAAPDARSDEAGAVAAIDAASLLFLPGGSPARLLTALSAPTLTGALRRLLDRGGVLVGASAGAMVLAEVTLLPERGGAPDVVLGLGFVPGTVVLPHYRGDERWWRAVRGRHDVVGLGLPECSGVIVRDGRWHPAGAAAPVLLRGDGHAELDSALPAPVWRDTSP
jgi:cyanophycinase